VDVDVLTHVLNPSTTKLQSKCIASVRSRVANLCEYLPEIPDIQTFSQRLEEILSNNHSDTEYQLSETDLTNIQQLTDKKFATWEWNYGRSPKATLSHSARLACGTVEIHLTLAENRIASCRFGGDFLGNLPTTDLESALIDVVYNTESIRERLSSFTISDYFDKVTVEELIKLIMP
jgi:lipoate-protein ligase A